MGYMPEVFCGADRLVRECAGVKAEEQVLILTDTACSHLGQAIMSSALTITKSVSMMVMPVYGRLHGQNPPKHVAEAMKAADIVFMPTVWSMSHSSARRDATELGVRCLTIPSADDELFARTIPEAPFREMKPVVMEVNRFLSEANEARVTTAAGTDMWFDLRGRRNVDLEHGWVLKGYPEYSSNWAAPPCIEANIAPLEYTSHGTIVVDAAQSAVGLTNNPILLTVEKGRIVKIDGGVEADELKIRLSEIGDPDMLLVAEIGIGLNPRARLRGQFIEDESVYGTAHVGVGNNESSMAGRIRVSGHFDNIFWRPTISLDGNVIMKDGSLCIPGLAEMKGRYVY